MTEKASSRSRADTESIISSVDLSVTVERVMAVLPPKAAPGPDNNLFLWHRSGGTPWTRETGLASCRGEQRVRERRIG